MTPEVLGRVLGAGQKGVLGEVLGKVLVLLASRKRCDLKTRKRCDFYSAAQKIASDFSAISSAIFWRFFCDFCGKTCDLVLCDFENAAIFLRLRFFGTPSLSFLSFFFQGTKRTSTFPNTSQSTPFLAGTSQRTLPSTSGGFGPCPSIPCLFWGGGGEWQGKNPQNKDRTPKTPWNRWENAHRRGGFAPLYPEGPNLGKKSISLERLKTSSFRLKFSSSRLKTSISLEIFQVSILWIPHKIRGLVGGSLEIFNLAWKCHSFQSRLKISIPEGDLEFFQDLGPLGMGMPRFAIASRIAAASRDLGPLESLCDCTPLGLLWLSLHINSSSSHRDSLLPRTHRRLHEDFLLQDPPDPGRVWEGFPETGVSEAVSEGVSEGSEKGFSQGSAHADPF